MLKIKNISLFLMMLLVSALTFTACEDDPSDLETDDDQTLLEFLDNNSERFSTLASALDRTGLATTLDNSEDYTVFAPNNAAFAALGINLDDLSDTELRNVLRQHIIMDKKVSDINITFEDRYYTSDATGPNGSNLSLLIVDEGDDLMVNGVRVLSDDEIDLDEVVLYEIEEVLMPMNIVEMAMLDEDLSELVSALGKADGDLVSTLSSEDGDDDDTNNPLFTVFAPENDAFEDIAETTANLDAEQLAKVLTYHVVMGSLQSDDLSDEQVVTTVNGETFMLEIDGDDITIRDADDNEVEVRIADVQTTNGVIHIIKEVLMPASL